MSEKYAFNYEPVSVYANAVALIIANQTEANFHIDIGCGNAAIAKDIEAAGKIYIGFDSDKDTVDKVINNGYRARQIDINEPDAAIEIIQEECKAFTNISCITMLDVVEHLSLDNRFLKNLSENLRACDSEAPLVLSVPNFAHFDVSVRLFGGRWDYTDTGLLDRTHRTIYTESLLQQQLQEQQWSEVDSLDYKLELSDQFTTGNFHPLQNRSKGLGRQLRGLKSILDKKDNTHQFVRCYKPAKSDTLERKHTHSLFSKKLSVIIVINGNPSDEDLLTQKIKNLCDRGVDVHVLMHTGIEENHAEFLKNLVGDRNVHIDSEVIQRKMLLGEFWTIWHNDDTPNEIYFTAIEEISSTREKTIWRLKSDESDILHTLPQPFTDQLADDSIFRHPSNASPALIFPTIYLDAFQIETLPTLEYSKSWVRFLLLCHIRIGTSESRISSLESFSNDRRGQASRYYSDIPAIRNDIDEVTSIAWPNANEVKEWFTLHCRIDLRKLGHRNAELESNIYREQALIDALNLKIQASEKDAAKLKIALQEKEMERQSVEAQKNAIYSDLKEIRSSTSWKITSPIRLVSKLFLRHDR